MKTQRAAQSTGESAADPGYVYLLAAVAAPADLAESMVQRALGEGDGEVILVAQSAAQMNQALQHLQGQDTATPQDQPVVTPRETEVLSLLSKGLRTSEIAEALHLSSNTVSTHLRHVFRKLGVGSRGEAVFEAMRMNLIQPF